MFLTALVAFIPLIHGVQELGDQLPMTESAAKTLSEKSILAFQEGLENLLAIPDEERTYNNTIRAWDSLNGNLAQAQYCLSTLSQVHPEKSVRDCLDEEYQKTCQTFCNALAAHPEIYGAFAAVKDSSLSEMERYYLDQLFIDCERMGMQLPDSERALFAQTQQEILSLACRFNQNISEDIPILYVAKEDLAGLDPGWIDAREQNEEGKYRLVCDPPTSNAVMTQCAVRETRKAVFELFTNRAFPENEEVIKQLIAKRDFLAKLLGFPSYAAYDLETQMAGSPEKVEAFLAQMREKAAEKGELEFQAAAKELPESVVLTDSELFEKFDELFVYNAYKTKHFSANQQEIAAYFPLEKTLEGLLTVYQRFFGIAIREVPHSIPIPDLKALEIRDSNEKLLGVVLLDLFPRQGKSSHSGICFSLIPAYSPPGGPDHPAACFLLCNFARPSSDRPSLLTHGNATSLFHEFGHALHFIFGKNEFLSFSGIDVINIKYDFAELPSQLLEKWLLDPQILKLVSSHYLTGEPLSDEGIQNLIRSQYFGAGAFLQRHCFLSTLSLAFYSEGQEKDPTELMQQISAREFPRSFCGPNTHFHASWWHVPGYGAKYYSYLWSRVYAADLFEKIQKQGLLNPAAGAAYAKAILCPGGGRDPHRMLTDYLGREPSLEPFFKELSLE